MPTFNAVDPRYKVGAGFDLLFKYRRGIINMCHPKINTGSYKPAAWQPRALRANGSMDRTPGGFTCRGGSDRIRCSAVTDLSDVLSVFCFPLSELPHGGYKRSFLNHSMAQLLSIVIPTRNRAELLELSLRSVFEQQDRVPSVIVSDNSTSDIPALQSLQKRYGFFYVRQSGKLSMTEHHNACLRLAPTPWVLLLHDDDELYPNILAKLESLLAKCGDAGVVVGGIQYINENGAARGIWVPDLDGTFKGEDIVLRLGLDYRVCPPGILWNVSACHELGGFSDANGVANEQALVLRLAYSEGAILFPEIVGRYRIWPDQTTNYSTPERAEHILDITIQEAQSARTIGVSASAADQLADYFIWWVFRFVIPLFSKHPFFVSRMCHKCELASPSNGAWRNRVKSEHPYLFWKPRRLSILCFITMMKLCPRPIREYLKLCSFALYKTIKSLSQGFYRLIG